MSDIKKSKYYKALEQHHSQDDNSIELKYKAEAFRSDLRIQFEEQKRAYSVASNSFNVASIDGNVQLLLDISSRMRTIQSKMNDIISLMEQFFHEELPE
jgi:hypothetical protein